MTKHQVIWLIIRLFGVYCAYLTLVTLFGLLGSIPALFTLPKLDTNNRNANISQPMSPTRVQPISPTGNYDVDDAGGKTDKKDGESVTDKFKAENFTTFLSFLLLTGIYGALTWYLIGRGKFLFEILDREATAGEEKEKEPEVTTLNLSDKQS